MSVQELGNTMTELAKTRVDSHTSANPQTPNLFGRGFACKDLELQMGVLEQHYLDFLSASHDTPSTMSHASRQVAV